MMCRNGSAQVSVMSLTGCRRKFRLTVDVLDVGGGLSAMQASVMIAGGDGVVQV